MFKNALVGVDLPPAGTSLLSVLAHVIPFGQTAAMSR
jgi:hypothetical protein